MVLGRISHGDLFVEPGDGEFGLPKLDLHTGGKEESQACFLFFLYFFRDPLRAASLYACPRVVFLINSV